jgi:hypothetical protein
MKARLHYSYCDTKKLFNYWHMQQLAYTSTPLSVVEKVNPKRFCAVWFHPWDDETVQIEDRLVVAGDRDGDEWIWIQRSSTRQFFGSVSWM